MTQIDWALIARAMSFYKERGYLNHDVPWIVDHRVAEKTFNGDGIKTDYGMFSDSGMFSRSGTLIGSGEQGFLTGQFSSGKWVTCTPCFRKELNPSDETRFWFMKVELFSKEDYPDYTGMMNDALVFMLKYANCEIVETDEGHDIMANGLELGSYGSRSVNGETWCYGTGAAFPRLSIARSRRKAEMIND